MRIERVVIEGFGAIKGETLEFAPGMTMIFGPNESAKTTLHSATYAALCGMRRGRGQPKLEDKLFAERHRPWDGHAWRVQAVIQLEGGKQIELSHDLDGRVDCRALDVVLNRDVSSEIMFDGSPDASRWLGFDRNSFVATACVRQSAIAAVLDNANALQDELQRAAASAGRDETAAGAIERLRVFSSEKVGLDRANSTKPLRRAIVAGERSEEALVEAQKRHDEYLALLATVDAAETARNEHRRRLMLAEAAVARAAAAKAQRDADRAAELAQRYPQEPHGVAGEGKLADEVAEALALWEGCPPEPDLTGETAEALEAQIASLPERPDGDLTPAQEVLDADLAVKSAERVLAEHMTTRPEIGETVALDPVELDRLAVDLDGAAPAIDPGLLDHVETLRTRVATPPIRRRNLPLAVAGGIAVLALAVGALASPEAGAALLAAAVLIATTVWWFGRQRPDEAAAAALATAERMLRQQEEATETAQHARAATEARLRSLGLPMDAAAIRSVAAEIRAAADAAGRLDAWESHRARLAQELEGARGELRRVLGVRQVEVGEDLSAAVATYREACRAREAQEREAAQRPRLEQRLAARRAADADAVARTAARDRLLAAAKGLEIDEESVATAAQRLREWQAQRQNALGEHDRATAEWSELQQLASGRTVEELAAVAAELASRAETLAEGFSAAELDAVEPDVAAQQIDDLRAEVEDLEREASLARGQVEQMAVGLASVPEAEERLAAANAELVRVRALEDVLKRTIDFLEQAQERVHRTIAPILQATLREWLPRVVVSRDGGSLVERYDDVLIDPETLRVQVLARDGAWRNASNLSEGTKEQIFLLLRVALAEHLTTPGERAPLILDEITAQCDADRRVALLQLLHELSAQRQVVLFTHDEGALAWAQAGLDLDGGRDRIELREPVAASPALAGASV